ncbi:TPA: hypothetical protein DCX16_03790 [bacterium]|nr:hypothetical protein [bacterium]
MLDTIRYTFGILFRQHPEFEDIEYFKAREIKIEAERHVLVRTDCEVIGAVPMKFSIATKILPVILPRVEK